VEGNGWHGVDGVELEEEEVEFSSNGEQAGSGSGLGLGSGSVEGGVNEARLEATARSFELNQKLQN